MSDSAIRFTADGESALRDHLVWEFGRHASVAGAFHADNEAIGHLTRVIAEEIEEGRRRGYRAAVQEFHEAHPDHCGGECFRESSIPRAPR